MSKLHWGMIGGGEGSQIGPVHRICSALDARFELQAAALDVDPRKGTRLRAASRHSAGSRLWRLE